MPLNPAVIEKVSKTPTQTVIRIDSYDAEADHFNLWVSVGAGSDPTDEEEPTRALIGDDIDPEQDFIHNHAEDAFETLRYALESVPVDDELPEFIILVQTDNAGVSNDDQFQFTGAQGDYDVEAERVDDEGSASFNDLSDEATITLPAEGQWKLKVTPKETNGFDRIIFHSDGDRLKLLEVQNWGSVVWGSVAWAYNGCNNLKVTADDVPDLSQASDARGMFMLTNLADSPSLGNWDWGAVTSLLETFRNSGYNYPVDNWVVDNVTHFGANTLTGTFRDASVNQDLGQLKISTGTTHMVGFLRSADDMSRENYNRTLIGLANLVYSREPVAPTDVGGGFFGRDQEYDDTVYGDISGEFNDAVSARNFLTASTGDGGAGWTITGDSDES